MTDPSLTDWCPYPGLASFQEAHQRYYFGREADARILAENVLGRRIVVLVGPSGTGKTSLLNVGLPEALHCYGISARLVCRNEWIDSSRTLSWLAAEATQSEGGCDRPLIIILDQFEEYFYYRDIAATETLEGALSAILERTDIEAHVLISLRDDAFVRLDALRAELPEILDTIIELEPLDDDAVRRVVEGPIEIYNQSRASCSEFDPVKIDSDFTEKLISALRGALNSLSTRHASPHGINSIELPFLQLTLARLWGRMQAAGDDRHMSAAVLEELGGVNGIVKDHVARKLQELRLSEKLLASAIFHYMVTPSGGKFAYLPEDLAVLVAESSGLRFPADKIKSALHVLADGETRLLRQRDDRFELFHDILARPILDWRVAYMETAPFACLVDIFTGKPYYLLGFGCLFGRLPLAEDDDVSTLAIRSVSRCHLLVLKNFEMLDLRSRFGTTVNAKPVRFGEPIQLASGDVLGLANTAVLRFFPIEDFDETAVDGAVEVESSPEDAWALLIDGSRRTVVPIKGQPTYLTIDSDNRIRALEKPDAATFASVYLRPVGGSPYAYLEATVEYPELHMVHRVDAFRVHEEPLSTGEAFWIDLREWDEVEETRVYSTRVEGAASKPGGTEAAKRAVFRRGEYWFEIIRSRASFKHVSATYSP